MAEVKETLVFIHGVSHGAWCWEEHFIPYFQQFGYDCRAFNLPGHDTPGPTRGINRLTWSDYVAHLEEVVASIDKPPVLIGHSMGGMIVQKYLEKHSCKKAVLLAPVPVSGALRATLNFLRRHPRSIVHLIQLNIYGAFYDYAREILFSSDFDEALLSRYKEKMGAESFKAYLKLLAPGVKINYHTQVPMLVLGAANDYLFTPKEFSRTAQKYNADYLLIEDIAHDMMLDTRHTEVAEVIRDWLEGKVMTNG